MQNKNNPASRFRPQSTPLMLGVCLAASCPVPTLAADSAVAERFRADTIAFHIDRQPLSAALLAFSEAAGIKIFFNEDLVSDIESPDLEGRYTPEAALKKLLDHTDLNYRLTDSDSIALERPSGARLTVDTLLAMAPAEQYEGLGMETEGNPDPVIEQEEMTVSGQSLGAYITPYSTAGTKFPIEITRVPQSIQVITEDAIKDRGAQSISDIMKQVPSATLQGSRFTRFPGINIRGFNADTIRNGIRQVFFTDTDFSALSHIQRVEVLKGPGSTVFGQAQNAGGGVINIVTKRPYDGFGAEVSFTRGGWTGFDGDITSGQWDFNAPLTPDGALKMRFTGEVEGSDTFIDFQELNRENFGLMLAYDDGGPVRAYINAEHQHRQTLPNPALPAIGTVQSSGIGSISRDTFLGEPKFDNLTSDATLVQAWVEIDVLDNWNDVFKDWKVIPRYQYQEFGGDQDQLYLGARVEDDRRILISRTGRSDFHERDLVHIGQIDITGTLETGPLSHQLFISGDYQYKRSPPKNYWFNRTDVPEIDALDPSYLDTPPDISSDKITFGQNYEAWAATFQDVVSITPYFDLIGGFRYTDASGQPRGNLARRVRPGENEVENTSFQIGGTFHLTDSIHLFSGYSEGFSFNVVGQKADGSSFDPEISEQVEAGVKVNFPWGLNGTASFFEITRSNVTTKDPVNPGFSVQTGEVRHRGAEVELAYQVTDQWYIQGGYAYIDSEITKSNDGDQGNRFQNTPEHQANLWTHYRFDSGLLENLTLSAGMNFVGDRPLLNNNAVELPNYTTVDLGASYTYKQLKLELFANNILDKRYFIAADFGPTVFPGDPRSIVGRVSLKY